MNELNDVSDKRGGFIAFPGDESVFVVPVRRSAVTNRYVVGEGGAA